VTPGRVRPDRARPAFPWHTRQDAHAPLYKRRPTPLGAPNPQSPPLLRARTLAPPRHHSAASMTTSRLPRASRGGIGARQPRFPLPRAPLRSGPFAGAAAPPCAVVRSAPPVLARASALDRFAASRACFPTQPRAEPSPDGRLRPSPAMRRRARLVAGASRCRQLARPARSRPISILGSRSNPTSGKLAYTGQPWRF